MGLGKVAWIAGAIHSNPSQVGFFASFLAETRKEDDLWNVQYGQKGPEQSLRTFLLLQRTQVVHAQVVLGVFHHFLEQLLGIGLRAGDQRITGKCSEDLIKVALSNALAYQLLLGADWLTRVRIDWGRGPAITGTTVPLRNTALVSTTAPRGRLGI